MQIVGIGTDIVECLRVGRMIEQHGEQFLARIYTEGEIRFCQSRKRATEHFAARWAAKEAIFKAMGIPWRRGMEWTDVEIRQEAGLVPEVLLAGATKDRAQSLRIASILLSIAHCRAYATAYAIALRGESPPPGRA
jgi:holo-[acyl-carrier protein] synthase